MRNRIARNGIIAGMALVLAGVFLAPMPVSAQPGSRDFGGPMRGGPGGMPGLRELDLSDAQRDQIRSVRQQHRNPALAEQLRAAKRALHDSVTADVVNESAIRGLAAQVAPLEAAAAIQRAYAHAAVLQILTADQHAELSEIQADAREFGERRRQRRQGR